MVGGQNADKRNIFKIKPLGDHLCTHHDGDLLFPELLKQCLVASGGLYGIGIHPYNARVGKKLLELLLDKLGTRSYKGEQTAAVGTERIRLSAVPAIVTHKPAV